jgi:hypothetical protein
LGAGREKIFTQLSLSPGSGVSGLWIAFQLIIQSEKDGNSNQGIWIDVLIPKDVSAGTYSGKATVTISSKTFKEIPIHLKVNDFTLPDSKYIKNMFDFSTWDMANRHGVTKGSSSYYQLETKYNQMAHCHRFDIVCEVSNLSDMTNYYKKYLAGEIYTPGSGYAGPGENIGNTTF